MGERIKVGIANGAADTPNGAKKWRRQVTTMPSMIINDIVSTTMLLQRRMPPTQFVG
jgi:hypothetical protein